MRQPFTRYGLYRSIAGSCCSILGADQNTKISIQRSSTDYVSPPRCRIADCYIAGQVGWSTLYLFAGSDDQLGLSDLRFEVLDL
jgi:hypothetical protein